MANIVMWVSIGLLIIFLTVGLLMGLFRGLKRSSLHFLFLAVSVVIAYFITKPIAKAILEITINVDSEVISISEFIIKMIEEAFDISQLETLTNFATKLPNAIVSPILFILLTLGSFLIFNIIYMIVARVSFGSKKKDFQNAKPYRAFGGVIGMVEGLMFLIVLFAPLTSLTKTYQEIAQLPPAEVQTLEENSNKMKTIAESMSEIIPADVHDAIISFNNGVVGKIAGAGGVDNLLFDGLADFEINGEKISIRDEVVTTTKVYDDFVEIYNIAIDKTYTSADFTSLKTNLTKLLDNGIFKAVISDTINELVIKFDELKESLNLKDLPQLAQDLITELHARFTEEGFDTYEYLKADVLKVVDIVEEIFKSDLINKYNDLEDKSLIGILTLIDENNETVTNAVQDVLNLNLIKDTFKTLGDYASEEIAKALENDKGFEIGLNTDIEDRDQMVEDVLGAINKFLKLNESVDIAELLESTDIVETLTNIDNLDEVLEEVGITFDALREMEIFVLPVTQTRTEKVYVFDNILKLYNLDLLNDEVYITPEATTKTKLNTYTLFFNYIKTPINTAKQIGLTDIGEEGTTFDSILDRVLIGLDIKEDIFSDILLPFYQITAMDLNELVFDNIVNSLSDTNNTKGLIDFTKVKTEAAADTVKGGVEVWDRELTLIGKTLKALNRGSVEVNQTTKTYLKALLAGGVEYDTIFKAMIDADHLSTTLDPIFTAVSFEGLTADMFDNIDTTISDLTGVKPTTDLTNLSETKAQVIETIENLLTKTLNNEELTLPQLGQILDILKVNAYNDGEKDGVFNEIFANVIWYMTGDDITGKNKFAGYTPNENAADVKAYLDIAETDNFVGYYTVESYQSIMSDIQDALDLANALSSNLAGIELADETIATYVSEFKKTIDSMTQETEEEKAEVINNLKKLIDGNSAREQILDEQDKTDYGTKIIAAIDHAESGISATVGTALKNLLGIS